MSNTKFQLKLYGRFQLSGPDGAEYAISSAKLRGLLALLALAPENRMARSEVVSFLWQRSGVQLGRATLRRELSNLKSVLGAEFDRLLNVSKNEIALQPGAFQCVGCAADGTFLANLTIREPRFETWMSEQRSRALDGRLKLPSAECVRLNPTICVAPFQTFSQDANLGPLGDLMAMEIARSLTQCNFVDVISHLSSRKLDLQRVDLGHMRRDMNSDYLLMGTVKHSGAQMVIGCDLIDVQSGRLLWTDTFSDKIAYSYGADWPFPQNVAQQVLDHVMREAVVALHGGAAGSVQVHQRLMGAIGLMHQHRPDAVRRARAELQQLAQDCPDRSVIHAWMAKLHVLWAHQGWQTDGGDSAAEAHALTRRALALDPHCSFSRAIHGLVLSNLSRDFSEGREHMDAALRSDPSNALAWLLKGVLLAFSEEGGGASVHCTTKARNLSPLDPQKYYYDCLAATAHLTVGEDEIALRLAQSSYDANPRHISTLRARTVALERLGQMREAKDSAAELMRRDPDFTIARYLAFHPAAKFAIGESWARSMAAAGVPLR